MLSNTLKAGRVGPWSFGQLPSCIYLRGAVFLKHI